MVEMSLEPLKVTPLVATIVHVCVCVRPNSQFVQGYTTRKHSDSLLRAHLSLGECPGCGLKIVDEVVGHVYNVMYTYMTLHRSHLFKFLNII